MFTGLFWLSLAAKTQRVDALLELLAGKVGLRNLKIPCQLHAIGDVLSPRAQADLGLHLNRAGHDLGIGANSELEQVFDSGMFQRNVEFDVVTSRALDAHHLSPGS